VEAQGQTLTIDKIFRNVKSQGLTLGIDDQMVANEYGRIVQTEWAKTAEMRRDVVLGDFVIMPNHFHGILRIIENRKQEGDRVKGDRQVAPTGPKTKSVGAFGTIMAGIKSAVTKRNNTMRGTSGTPVWQRNYFEHIIRNDTDHQQIAKHLLTNPSNNTVGATCWSPF
jgi:REP element-mobilizing transposase RayT